MTTKLCGCCETKVDIEKFTLDEDCCDWCVTKNPAYKDYLDAGDSLEGNDDYVSKEDQIEEDY